MLAAAAVAGQTEGRGGAQPAAADQTPPASRPTDPPRPARNPLGRDEATVTVGRALYEEKCAVCHGLDAKGGMGTNLIRNAVVASGSDEKLFGVIRQGVPGSIMPPQDLPENSIWRLVSYLHNLARPGRQPPVPGDAAAGQEVFQQAGCGGCHIVEGRGGFLGPELNSVGDRRTSEEIRQAILDPGAVVAEGYRTVAVTGRDGTIIEGVLRNEDTFSLQVLTREGFFLFLARDQSADVQLPRRSLMPGGYGRRLTDEQLQNLLAFLDRRRAPFTPVERQFWDY